MSRFKHSFTAGAGLTLVILFFSTGCQSRQASGGAKTTPPTSIDLASKFRGGNTEVRCVFLNAQGYRFDYSNPGQVAGVAGFDRMDGQLTYDPASDQVTLINLRLSGDSFQPAGLRYPMSEYQAAAVREHLLLSADHPSIRFTSTAIRERRPEDFGASFPEYELKNAYRDHRHTIVGRLEVAGQTHPVMAIARITPGDTGPQVEVELRLNLTEMGFDLGHTRERDYDHPTRQFRNWKEQLTIEVQIDNRSGLDLLREDVLTLREEYRSRIQSERYRVNMLREQVDWLVARDQLVHARMLSVWKSTRVLDLDRLAKRFTDEVPRYRYESKTELDPVPFGMVLIPGDPEKQIEPFYISATEVSWEMMRDWAYSRDISVEESAMLQSLGLRPSWAYEDMNPFRWVRNDQPAMGMSYRTATTFCIWLSEKTGRIYRIPTYEEWQHVFELGGGMPGTQEALLQQACVRENAPLAGVSGDEAFDPFADADREDVLDDAEAGWLNLKTMRVDALQPNALGIHNMLGNAAEWVQPDDRGRRRVVGGHYMMKAEELMADWVAYEDQDIWNATYPQRPPSESWYKDFPVTGLRLVCEPVNVPVDIED